MKDKNKQNKNSDNVKYNVFG